MRAERGVLDDAHIGDEFDMLESARDAESGDVARLRIADRAAVEKDVAGGQRQDAGDQVENGALARAVRADQRDDLPCCHGKIHGVDGSQPTEALDRAAYAEQRPAETRRMLPPWQWLGGHIRRRRAPVPVGYQTREARPQPLARILQHGDHRDAEDHGLHLHVRADKARRHACSASFSTITTPAPSTAPQT